MHFSIPDTQDIKDDSISPFVAYNIHVNGALHCTVRYKQLLYLHDQLRKEFGPNSLPMFPPKKFFPLNPAQLEERRVHLEKYIQQISQDTRIINSETFNGFLLTAQQESQHSKDKLVDLDVYLMNWQKITISVSSFLHTSSIMEALASSLNFDKKFCSYFCLYLVKKQQNGVSVVRRLLDFESPFLSLKIAGSEFCLVIRKSYWDLSYDEALIENRVTLNLLYIQAVSDVELGWIQANEEMKKHLATLQSRGSKYEYLRLAQTLKFYGYVQFNPCVCDYPKPNTMVLISAGGKDFVFQFPYTSLSEKEVSFRVTRIKCWRITTSVPDNSSVIKPTSHLSSKLRLELSFEYLVGKDELKWICITSDQAILMSLCLQEMVDELLLKRKEAPVNNNKYGKMTRSGSWNYMRRDGSSYQISAVCRSISQNAIVNKKEEASFVTNQPKDPLHKKTDKHSAVTGKHSTKNGSLMSKELIENSAFEGIGDEDL